MLALRCLAAPWASLVRSLWLGVKPRSKPRSPTANGQAELGQGRSLPPLSEDERQHEGKQGKEQGRGNLAGCNESRLLSFEVIKIECKSLGKKERKEGEGSYIQQRPACDVAWFHLLHHIPRHRWAMEPYPRHQPTRDVTDEHDEPYSRHQPTRPTVLTLSLDAERAWA